MLPIRRGSDPRSLSPNFWNGFYPDVDDCRGDFLARDCLSSMRHSRTILLVFYYYYKSPLVLEALYWYLSSWYHHKSNPVTQAGMSCGVMECERQPAQCECDVMWYHKHTHIAHHPGVGMSAPGPTFPIELRSSRFYPCRP